MTQDQLEVFAKLTPQSLERLVKVARRIAEGYEGEILLLVKGGRPGERSGISVVRWTEVDRE